MATLPIPELITHTRRVQSLYKRSVRNIESFIDRREVARYYITVLRERFDKNMDVKDTRIAKQLVAEGERELESKLHWHIRQFPQSPGGTDFERDVPPDDWVLDYWHPLEKAQYPEYFEKREKGKLAYFKFYNKWAKSLKIDNGEQKDKE